LTGHNLRLKFLRKFVNLTAILKKHVSHFVYTPQGNSFFLLARFQYKVSKKILKGFSPRPRYKKILRAKKTKSYKKIKRYKKSFIVK